MPIFYITCTLCVDVDTQSITEDPESDAWFERAEELAMEQYDLLKASIPSQNNIVKDVYLVDCERDY